MQFPVVAARPGLGGRPPPGRVPGQIGVARARVANAGRGRGQQTRTGRSGRSSAGGRSRGRGFARRVQRQRLLQLGRVAVHGKPSVAGRGKPSAAGRRRLSRPRLFGAATATGRAPKTRGPDRVQPRPRDRQAQAHQAVRAARRPTGHATRSHVASVVTRA